MDIIKENVGMVFPPRPLPPEVDPGVNPTIAPASSLTVEFDPLQTPLKKKWLCKTWKYAKLPPSALYAPQSREALENV